MPDIEPQRHIWVILCEQGLGYSWTDFAFWGVAESYEAAKEKLQQLRPGSGWSASWTTPDDVTVWTARMTWRIRKVAL